MPDMSRLCDLDLILAHSLQALGADFDAHQLTIPKNFGLLNVGLELAPGMSLGKTDVVPGHSLLTTYLTNSHNITFSSLRCFHQYEAENTSAIRI